MSFQQKNIRDLLTEKDIEMIDSSDLTVLAKHHLRLLAYCLQTFKLASNDCTGGSLPTCEKMVIWLKEKYCLLEDESFTNVLIEQFDVAAIQLDEIASQQGIKPLDLTLQDLLASAKAFQENL